MKVLQFAFGDTVKDNEYLPHNYPNNCVVYTGTHDNDTTMGWFKTASKATAKFAKKYFCMTKEEGLNWGMMRGAWASAADMAIVPMQDIIGLGSEARINIPSTLGENWKWRATSDQISNALAKKIYKYTEMYARLVVKEDDEELEEAGEKAEA